MRYLAISLLLIVGLIVLAIGLPFVAQAVNPVIDEQHTAMLRLLVPSWDQQLDSINGDANGCNSERFACVMGGAAVRDNETGIVWERSPDVSPRDWTNAIAHCAQREISGRKGWHLPMREQLASLVDSSNSNPSLPTAHPFTNVLTEFYWSATTSAPVPGAAWSVDFRDGSLGTADKGNDLSFFAWCVRGGQSFDGNTHSTLH